MALGMMTTHGMGFGARVPTTASARQTEKVMAAKRTSRTVGLLMSPISLPFGQAIVQRSSGRHAAAAPL